MTDLSDLSIRELAALVCDTLRKEGLKATLSFSISTKSKTISKT